MGPVVLGVIVWKIFCTKNIWVKYANIILILIRLDMDYNYNFNLWGESLGDNIILILIRITQTKKGPK